MPQPKGRPRGRKSAITPDLWPEIQRRHRAGETLDQIGDWLRSLGIEVHKTTVMRALDRVCAAAPLPEPPAPALEPATDDEELRAIRAEARKEMREGDEWRQRHSAMGILMRTIELRRKAQSAPQPPAGEQPEHAAPSPSADPPQADLSPEQEAELAMKQLQRMAQA